MMVPTEEACPHATVIQWWHQQCQSTPDRTAVVTEHRSWTYRELDQCVHAFSHRLVVQGCRPGAHIGLCVDRSAEAIAAMLAVMQIGAAFVPLDPEYPPDRLATMVHDADIKVIVGHQSYRTDLAAGLWESLGDAGAWIDCESVLSDLDNAAVADLKTWSELHPQAGDLAYLMYTSGSTGRPKGVEISQRALVTYCAADIQCYQLTPDDRTLQFSTLCFDIAIEEIFPPLLSGGCVVVRPRDRADDSNELSTLIERFHITAVHLATAFWHSWVDLMVAAEDRVPSSLRLVIATGEKVSVQHFRRWQQISDHDMLWCNAYGPTEATVTATVFIPDASFGQDSGDRNMPIGKPLPGYTAYILDKDRVPVASGETGELCIGGPALAVGYHKRPELTEDAFINVVIDDAGQRLYRTGDLARFLPDGNIDFGGRLDHQIKLGSYRIEPGEIEVVINKIDGVLESLVSYDEANQQKFLVAYIARGTSPMTASQLAEQLRGCLPPYMIPARYVFLDAFPKTINGKIDRDALPSSESGDVPKGDNHIAPRNELERRLAQIWKEVLHLPEIGIHDDFFLLGGSSLLVTQVITHLTRQWSVDLPVRDFFANPTIATSARQIRRLLADSADGPANEDDLGTKGFSDAGFSDADFIRSRLPEVIPSFFLSGDDSLFSVRYRPVGQQPIGTVVLAHSIGHEYTRAYRNLQQLAVHLCQIGFEVLRFDYAGTGNSQGDCAELTVDQMRQNLIDAKKYAAEKSAAQTTAVIGVRLGATVASSLPIATFDHTILWDPVKSGAAFLSMLEGFHQRELQDQTRFNVVRKADPKFDQLYGHAMNPTKRASLASLRLTLRPDHQVISTDDEIYWQEHQFCEAAFSSPKSYAAIEAAVVQAFDTKQKQNLVEVLS
jgi:amino acid adenylation domain-containing protein